MQISQDCLDLAKTLSRLLHEQPRDTIKIDHFRDSLMQKLNVVINSRDGPVKDRVLAENLLWRECIYRPIQEMRHTLKESDVNDDMNQVDTIEDSNKNNESKSNLHARMVQHIDHSLSMQQNIVCIRISELESSLSNLHSFKLQQIAGAAQLNVSTIQQLDQSNISEMNEETSRYCVWALHRALVRSGDLERYKSTYVQLDSNTQSASLKKAAEFYRKALLLLPQNGQPHNQLCVLAGLADADISLVYHSCRNLVSVIPFSAPYQGLLTYLNAEREKIVRMAKRPDIRRLASVGVNGLVSASPCTTERAKQLEEQRTLMKMWTEKLFIECVSYVLNRTSLDHIPRILWEIGKNLSRLLRARVANLTAIMQMTTIAMALYTYLQETNIGYSQAINDENRRKIHSTYAALVVFKIGIVLANSCTRYLNTMKKNSKYNPTTAQGQLSFNEELNTCSSNISILQALLTPLGLICDWFTLNPELLCGPISSQEMINEYTAIHRSDTEHTLQADNSSKSHRKRKRKRSLIHRQIAEQDVSIQLIDLRRQLLDGLSAVANRLSVNKLQHVFSANLEAYESVALPEEQELRAFRPLNGMYDQKDLPGSYSTTVFLGQYTTNERSSASISCNTPVSPLTNLEACNIRAQKVLRIVKYLTHRNDCSLWMHPLTKRFHTCENPKLPQAEKYQQPSGIQMSKVSSLESSKHHVRATHKQKTMDDDTTPTLMTENVQINDSSTNPCITKKRRHIKQKRGLKKHNLSAITAKDTTTSSICPNSTNTSINVTSTVQNQSSMCMNTSISTRPADVHRKTVVSNKINELANHSTLLHRASTHTGIASTSMNDMNKTPRKRASSVESLPEKSRRSNMPLLRVPDKSSILLANTTRSLNLLTRAGSPLISSIDSFSLSMSSAEKRLDVSDMKSSSGEGGSSLTWADAQHSSGNSSVQHNSAIPEFKLSASTLADMSLENLVSNSPSGQ